MTRDLIEHRGFKTDSDVVRTAIRFMWRDMFGMQGPPTERDEEEE